MSLAAPIWLFLLLPWGALAIWLLIGQRDRVAVPFLPLWNNTLSAPKTKRSFRAPPWAIMCLLLAILFGIFGAAGPTRMSSAGQTVTVLVDRGTTMSADDRLSSGIEIVRSHFAAIDLIPIPTGSVDRPVAMETNDLLNSAIVERVKAGRLVVVSDQPIERTGRLILQISPAKAVSNVDIVSVSARSVPRAEVMVRVRNQSELKTASVTVRSGAAVQTQQIQLPPREGEKNYFVDLLSLAGIVEVKLEAKDDLPIDNVAWLVRQRAWPKIEPVDPLPPEVRRMIAVYQKNRPASANSNRVVVANDIGHLPAGLPGIALASSNSPAPIQSSPLTIVPHELTRDVDWTAFAESASATTHPSGDWTPLVRAGDRVLLAVRESAHQAFVGIDTTSIASSPQFVVLFGKLFDWAGQGGERYSTDAVHAIDDEWKLVVTDESAKRYDPPLPGVYRRGDGALLAMSAVDVKFAQPIPLDLRKLDGFKPTSSTARDLRPLVLCIALLAALAALWMLKPRASVRR